MKENKLKEIIKKINFRPKVGKVAVIGIIGLLFSFFYILEPNLVIDKVELTKSEYRLYDGNTKAVMFLQLKMNVRNRSIKSGYIDVVDVYPFNISQAGFKVGEISIDKTAVTYFADEEVFLSITIYFEGFYWYSHTPSSFFGDQAWVFLNDNKGYSILDSRNEIANFLIPCEIKFVDAEGNPDASKLKLSALNEITGDTTLIHTDSPKVGFEKVIIKK